MSLTFRHRHLGLYWPGANHKPDSIPERNWAIAVDFMEGGENMAAISRKYGMASSSVASILDGQVYHQLRLARGLPSAYDKKALTRSSSIKALVAQPPHKSPSPQMAQALIDAGWVHPRWMDWRFWSRMFAEARIVLR